MIWFFVKEIYLCNMKTKEINTKKMVEVPQDVLLSLVAKSIKEKVLFPRKVARVREYLNNLPAKK